MKRLLVLFAIVLVGGAFVDAQSYNPIQTGDLQQQISTDVSPQYPLPGQTVTITLSAYGTNLNNASISWSVDGKAAQNGTGLTKFSVDAGQNGQSKKVTAVIIPPNQPSITKNFTISPQEVSIIYEADSYVPPFYKGKGLFNKEGNVRFVAMPNLVSSTGVRLNPSTLTYKWSVDDTVLGSQSGYGKNYLDYTGSILASSVTVEVEVSSADGTVSGKGAILSSPQSSEVLVYENSPVYGILFNKELGAQQFKLAGKEVTVEAIPFFTSAKKRSDDNLQYEWSINDLSIPVPTQQSHVTLRNTTGETGNSIIGVVVSNTTHLLQRMTRSATINF